MNVRLFKALVILGFVAGAIWIRNWMKAQARQINSLHARIALLEEDGRQRDKLILRQQAEIKVWRWVSLLASLFRFGPLVT